MTRIIVAATIAALAMTASVADARMAKKHSTMSSANTEQMSKTRELNQQQLANASGAGGAAPMSPGMAPAAGAPPMAPAGGMTPPPADGAPPMAPATDAAPGDAGAMPPPGDATPPAPPQ